MRARVPAARSFAAVGCLWLLATAAEGRTYRETTEERFSVATGAAVKLVNRNGNVEVEGWEGDEVWLEATKQVRARSAARARDAFEETEIRIREQEWGLEIETVPERSSSGWLGWLFGKSTVDVAYRLKVPAHLDLELLTVNGRIDVEGVAGETLARTTNGKVTLYAVRGPAELATTNGSVRAEFVALPADADLRLRSTNGGITVALPPGWGGQVEAKTTNGSVSTDLPITVHSTNGRRNRLEGEIAGGSGQLEIRTVNGSIRLEASP